MRSVCIPFLDRWWLIDLWVFYANEVGGADGGYVISPPFFMQMRPPMGVMLMSSRLLVSDWSVLFVLVSDWSVVSAL